MKNLTLICLVCICARLLSAEKNEQGKDRKPVLKGLIIFVRHGARATHLILQSL